MCDGRSTNEKDVAVNRFDDRACLLGEGVFWHPEREEYFWLDILNRTLLGRNGFGQHCWSLKETVSAMGWVNRNNLLLAGSSSFWLFDLVLGTMERLVSLEEDRPENRSNDGRADPFGGFWIGTMGWEAESEAGQIWRFWRGEVFPLFGPLTIPNAICFAPDGRTAYFADTPTRKIRSVALDGEGWPVGQPRDFAVIDDAEGYPDGAVVDADGNLWVAMWGGQQLLQFGPDGERIRQINLPVRQPTCPSFGGDQLTQLIVTSAAVGLEERGEYDGCTLSMAPGVSGQSEHQVILTSEIQK